jgi:hypothetical protein
MRVTKESPTGTLAPHVVAIATRELFCVAVRACRRHPDAPPPRVERRIRPLDCAPLGHRSTRTLRSPSAERSTGTGDLVGKRMAVAAQHESGVGMAEHSRYGVC